jgi:uncharacterized protein (DUF1778 family)
MTPPRKTAILIRLTHDQHEQLKLAATKFAESVGMHPSISAFCVKAAVDRAAQVLDDK